jgi:2-methylcitrate dehydratase
VTGPFAIENIGRPKDGLSAAERTDLKLFPSSGNLSLARLFIDLHREGLRPADVAAIRVVIQRNAWENQGGGRGDHDEKWDPKTRETADHSLPYMIAVTLTDGRLDRDSFASQRITDTGLRPLMNRITIVPSEEHTTWVGHPPTFVELALANGRRREHQLGAPRGNHAAPASDDELEVKFRTNATGLLSARETDHVVRMLWRFDELKELGDLMRVLREVGRPSG